MNKLIAVLIVLFLCTGVQSVSGRGNSNKTALAGNIQSEVSISEVQGLYSMSDTQFEWGQFKNKKASAILSNNGLVLQNQEKDRLVLSVTELPVDPESDSFAFGVCFNGPKLDDVTKVGLVLDYSDSRNYKGLDISKNQYCYYVVKDGVPSTIKTGLIKYKGNFYSLLMIKSVDKMNISLNGIDIATINRIKFEYPMFGVMLEGKGKTTIPNFIFLVEEKQDHEESTTDI